MLAALALAFFVGPANAAVLNEKLKLATTDQQHLMRDVTVTLYEATEFVLIALATTKTGV